MEAMFLKILAFLSFQISEAVRSSRSEPLSSPPIGSEDGAPPLVDCVEVSPKSGIEVHKPEPFLESVPNP
jgi:hypothetical protein